MEKKQAVTIVDLDETTLDAALQEAGTPLLLDLWAPWCAPCRAMAPTLLRLARAAQGSLRVTKLDVQQHAELAKRFGLRGIPCLILFKDGVESSRLTGLQNWQQLGRWLGEEGLSIAGLDTSPAAEDESPWGAFYGDQDLRDFLVQRVQRMADAKQLVESRFPYWTEKEATVSAALAHSDRPEIFERVTGLPYAFACMLELVDSRNAEEVSALFAALPVGADLRNVPLHFLILWLSDAELPWQALLDDEATNALRLRWVQACKSLLTGAQVEKQTWAELRAAAGSLTSDEPDQTVLDHFGKFIERLSPPPRADDTAPWQYALLLIGIYLKSVLAQSLHGWTRPDFAISGMRIYWFKKNAPDPATLTPDEISAWRGRYEIANAEAEARHAPAEARFFADWAASMLPVKTRLLAHLTQTLQQAQVLP